MALDCDASASNVDGDVQARTRRLVVHLRQVFDVDVHETLRIGLEGLFGGAVAPSAFGEASGNLDMPWRLIRRATPEDDASGLLLCARCGRSGVPLRPATRSQSIA
jgi:hypothetical protein